MHDCDFRKWRRYGRWEEHNSDETKKVSMVHGAVNNCRTDILLDSGASVSMMSLDLARRLKLRLKFCKQVRVSGRGGAPTIITATTEVKITLGPRVVYIMELWVANIGECVDVLLGINLMYSAGVRLCAREGLVKLPDEETVLLAGRTADHMGRGLDLAITPKTCIYLGPGESAVVRIDYGQRNPQREVVWAGRGDRWVTQIIYAVKSCPVAVEVVNISDKTVWIDSRTAVARIVVFGFFPTVGRFVRPGLRRYKEWQALIYENTNSREVRKREERFAQLRQESEPPCVRTPEYQWPKKLLVRSPAGSAQVHMVRLQPIPNVRKEKSPAKTDVQLSETEISGTSDSEGTESRPVVVLDEDSDSDDEAFYDAISFDGDDGDEDSQEVVEAEPSTGKCSDRFLLPVRRLEKEYERCMQMSEEELSLEPAVYIHEGSELLAQLRDELAMLPELQELSPECDIRMWCDMGVGDAKPVAHCPRSITPHLAIKVYELLKELLETGLMEHSGSPWASPIGFVRLSPEEEAEVDQDVLEFLGLDPSKREDSGSQVAALTDTVTVFQRNIPAPASMGPVLGRSSYIDDIAHGAPTWDQLCDALDALLFRLRYWNISVSLPKSEFVKLSIPYLSHEISAEGIRAVPKIAKGVQDLPFPKTLKGVQSFLGSLNYYHKFIEDFPVVAAVLYELSDDQLRSERDLTRAKAAFVILKKKIGSTPLLRHLDLEVPGTRSERRHVAEKEVIAVLRVLQVFRTLLEGCRLEVYTRHSVFKWILLSKTADGRCVPWGVILSHWDITIRKVQRDEDGLAAIMGAGIMPREHLDEVAESLIPAKGRVRKPPVLSAEMLDDTYQGIVLSFEGAATTSTRRGSCGCILWQLPGRKVLEARVFILDDVSGNDAEYNGLLKGVQVALDRQVENLAVVGDSRIVIQQVQGLINCHQLNLQKHLAECKVQKEKFRTLQLMHVKRENNEADYLTSTALRLGKSWIVQEPEELLHLERVSKIAEKLMKPKLVLMDGESSQNSERLGLSQGSVGGVADSQSAPLPQAARVFAVLTMSKTQARTLPSPEVVVNVPPDEEKPRRPMTPLEDFWDEPRLVIPDTLRSDMRHYAHEDFQGRPQGITRTYEKLRSKFYWPGLYADVEHYVKECLGCASDKGRPPNEGPSPGNIEPRRPFEVVSMDFVTHMPESERGNTFLLMFQDAFSGFVMCKPMRSTTAHDVAEVYEECVFRRFGASSMVRHDQDPRFMSATVVRSMRAYIAEADQSDWDDYAERLMFALNTSFDATRLNTPFYLVHGWVAQGTLSAMLGPKPSRDHQKKAKRQSSEIQTKKWKELSERLKSGFEKGDSVWLFITKVQPGLSRKLAHMWHGPFRIEEIQDDFRVKLKVTDSGYRVNPWVHVSRLKPRALFPKPPTVEIEVAEDDDFDAALLPEDSWEPDSERNEYEVEKILDLRWPKRTRTSRRTREYLVKWKGYDDPEWLPLSQLSCGALLYEFNQGARARGRFQTMEAGDDHHRA
ncbi:unnamed protein product [Phytophthora fragariaefolia]|uniref:RNA-directed DNA polymerase n=1 Tax=Phytophthora fragariaefolia TaxID=1490495 RepID=A0A9W6YM34_9STRA|nr:unnamed protein product [Phytophthora fragariaefolia]